MTQSGITKLPIWLIASLIANALLVGLLIGGGLAKRTPDSPQVPSSELAIARSIHNALPNEARRPVRRAFQRAYRETRPERLEILRLRGDLRDLLLADPYDQAAVIALLAELRAADSSMRVGLHEELALQLGELSPEQRQLVLQDLYQGVQRRRGGRRDMPHRRQGRRAPDEPAED